MPTSEKGTQQAIRKAVMEAYPDAWVVKIHGNPMQEVGIPDLIGCISGVTIGLEIKFVRPGESVEHAKGRTTLHQHLQLGKILRAGGIAATVTSPEEALKVIRDGLAAQEQYRALERDTRPTQGEGD